MSQYREKKIFELKQSGKPLVNTENVSTVDAARLLYGPMIAGSALLPLAERPSLVVDNGSYEFRAGWSIEPDGSAATQPYIKSRNQVGRPKTMNREVDCHHIVGDQFSFFEQSKIQKKATFDRNVVTQIQNVEHTLDYCFQNLGINEQIQSPLVYVEPVCNPSYCRSQTNELFFEGYGLPQVSYTNDCLAGYYNNTNSKYGLIISSSNTCTHIVPIIDGKYSASLTKRIPIGGSQHTDFLMKSLLLKYPTHRQGLGVEQIQEIQHNHTHCALNYSAQIDYLQSVYDDEQKQMIESEAHRNDKYLGKLRIKQLQEEIKMAANEIQSLTKRQKTAEQEISTKRLHDGEGGAVYKNRYQRDPEEEHQQIDTKDHIIQRPWQPELQPTPEELQRRHEMRKEQGRKLKEMMEKKRQEKNKKLQEELKDLEQIQMGKQDGSLDVQAYKEEIQQRSFSSVEQFTEKITQLRIKLKIKKEEDEDQSSSQAMETKYNLLSIQDVFLTPDQIKQKRIQKMQKTAALLREEKRIAKQEAKNKLEALKKSDNRNSYLLGLYQKRMDLMQRITDRKREREEFGKRGTQIAQKRMQKIAELGKEEKLTAAILADVSLPKNKDTTRDTFGKDDEDWDVYRDIQKDGFSEDDEDDQQNLNEIEEKIGELDEDFAVLLYEAAPESHRPACAEDYQIRLWTDRYRGAEILFQPSIIGLECAGLTEALENILLQVTNQQKTQMLENVVILGGNTLIPGFEERIEFELQMLNHYKSQVNIINKNRQVPRQIQPWLGAAKLAHQLGTDLSKYCISKQDYEENGSDYMKEHYMSNMYNI